MPETPKIQLEGKLLTVAEVEDLTSISRATLYRKIGEGSFPPPIKIGTMSRWQHADVVRASKAWVADQEDQQKKEGEA